MDPGNVERARGLHAGVQAVNPAQAEVDHASPLRRFDDTRRLGGEHRLQLDLVDDEGFDQLRFADRRHHFEDGFVREDRRAFGNCIDVAGETEPREMFEKPV